MNIDTIHSDKRGSIYSIHGKEIAYDEVAVLATKAGYARGGCIHRINDEHVCVISGVVEYHIDGHYCRLVVGDTIVTPKNTPHYLYSVTDSVVLEWGATPEEKKEKHLETRKIVEKINDSANTPNDR